MPYSKKYSAGKTFIGTLLPNILFAEFTRLCKLSGRSKAKETEMAVAARVKLLQAQERQGGINGIR